MVQADRAKSDGDFMKEFSSGKQFDVISTNEKDPMMDKINKISKNNTIVEHLDEDQSDDSKSESDSKGDLSSDDGEYQDLPNVVQQENSLSNIPSKVSEQQ
jgi:hypothetical protein